MVRVIHLRKDHPQAVVPLWIIRTDFNRPLERHAGFVPLLLLTISVPQVHQCNHVFGIHTQSFLKVRDRLRSAPFARGQQAQIVPGIGQRVRIAGL